MAEREAPAFLKIHPRVEAALASRRPIVALETAVVTHGLPRPFGAEVALEMVRRVRRCGAETAEIAVLDGSVRVGLEPDEIAALGARTDARKCALRDVAVLTDLGASGGTTVSATAWLAARVGVRVVVTGGIGGVHPGGVDVSADLDALARTPVVVVCSGPKSLLDVRATAEALDSLSVPVLGYRTSRLPAFYVRDAGLPVTARVEDGASVARIAAVRDGLGLRAALVVAVPVRRGAALPAEIVAAVVAEAEAGADASDAIGSDRTPFVLARLATLTRGATLRANRALLARNAAVAAQVAVAMARTNTAS